MVATKMPAMTGQGLLNRVASTIARSWVRSPISARATTKAEIRTGSNGRALRFQWAIAKGSTRAYFRLFPGILLLPHRGGAGAKRLRGPCSRPDSSGKPPPSLRGPPPPTGRDAEDSRTNPPGLLLRHGDRRATGLQSIENPIGAKQIAQVDHRHGLA